MDENGNYSQRYARNRPTNPMQPINYRPNNTLMPNNTVGKSKTFGGRKTKNHHKKRTKRRK